MRAIQVPAPYRKTQSRAGGMFLVIRGIDLIEGDVWGNRKDVQEYFSINDEVISRILDVNEIAGEISREAHLSLELIQYVIKQSS